MSKKDKKEQMEEQDKKSSDWMNEHVHCHCHEQEGECCCEEEAGFEPPHFVRQFYTREEKIEMLSTYLDELKAETQAVEEELADLRKSAE